MLRRTCQNCGFVISRASATCPHCCSSIKSQLRKKILFILLVIVVFLFFSIPSISALENNSVNITTSVSQLEEYRKEAVKQEKKRYDRIRSILISIIKKNSGFELERIFSDVDGDLICINGWSNNREKEENLKFFVIKNERRVEGKGTWLKDCGCLSLIDMSYVGAREP